MSDPRRIGKYEILGRLGEGGMGVVYHAYDPIIQRPVALKTIAKARIEEGGDAERLLARFRHEAQAAGRLQHPNIVAVYEYGEEENLAFIAMEYVPGKSLKEHMAGDFHPELGLIPEVFGQLLDALEYSHDRGVIHRDIKPGNIIISEHGRVKVSDFGIARIETSTLTMAGDVLGTPAYMSPEQFLGEAVDARTDLYAVAVLIYEVLAGRKPFEGGAAKIMRQVLDDTPQPPSHYNPAVPPQLDWVVLKGMAKHPQDRFQSAKEFRDAIQVAVVGHKRADSEPAVDTTYPVGPRAPDIAAAARKLRAPARPAAPGDAAPGAQAEITATRPPEGPARPRVLFVDDEERILNALRAIFRTRYEVLTATGGEQALRIIRDTPVQLVVSDQRMPGMLGVDLLRQVKEIAPSTVRILLTGYTDLASIVGSINDGEVYRFISKPWNNAEMQQTVAEAVDIALELQTVAPPAQAQPARSGAALLVVDDDQAIFRAARELLSDLCPVLRAASLEEALDVMAQREVAVLLADIEVGHADNTALFKLLKQERPQVLVIVATGASDSELVISLINQAQIFRFLNKPLNHKLMRSHVQAALAAYQSYKKAPQLLKSHKVQPAPEARESSVGKMIVERLRSLTGRFASLFGQGD